MTDEERFKDNENGTISDTRYNLMWAKEDSYQMRNKWCAWKGAHNYIAVSYTHLTLPTILLV